MSAPRPEASHAPYRRRFVLCHSRSERRDHRLSHDVECLLTDAIANSDLHAVPAFVAVHPVREGGKGIGDRFKAEYVAAVADIAERGGKLTDIASDIENQIDAGTVQPTSQPQEMREDRQIARVEEVGHRPDRSELDTATQFQ